VVVVVHAMKAYEEVKV